MTKKHKSRAKRPPVASADSSSTDAKSHRDVPLKPSPPVRKFQLSPIARRVIQGLVVAAILTLIKASWLEQTPFGEELEHMSINLLQRQLTGSSTTQNGPVQSGPMKIAVVDIASLSLVLQSSTPQQSQGAAVSVTDRSQLRQVVDNVAKADPLAIGIDVYFEPDAYGQMTPEDEQFLDHCLAVVDSHGKSIPVYVGIYGSIARGPGHWLGYDKFSNLGTAIIVPNVNGQMASSGRMIEQLEVNSGGNRISVDSLSYRLSKVANAGAPTHRRVGAFLHSSVPGLVLDRAPRTGQSVSANEFQIDFGSLDHLMESRVDASAVAQHLDELRNSIVLLGRATPGETTDVFGVGGFPEPVPGVYIHAAAIETLTRSPLYFPSTLGRILADLFTAVLAMALVEFAKKTTSHRVAEHFERHLPTAIAVLVSVAGCLWVGWTGIYWTDFLLVSLVLLLHTWVERILKSIFNETVPG